MNNAFEQVGPGLWRVPVASRTLPPFDHTNSYLIENGGVAVLVDPGSPHLEALTTYKSLLAEREVTLLKAVLLTHTHGDHVAGLEHVMEAFDAPIYVHPLEQGRLEVDSKALNPGRTLTVGDTLIQTVFTPGHSPGHLSFFLPETAAVLVGDMLAGQGSTWVGVPEGDVGDYLNSLDALAALEPKVVGPGHGPLIDRPAEMLARAKTHRLGREGQLVSVLGGSSHTLKELRKAIYPDLPESLATMAESSLLAHLEKLMKELRVVHLGRDEQGPYSLHR